MSLDPDHLSRLQDLYDWRATFQAAQVDMSSPAFAKWSAHDMDLCDTVAAVFADTLGQVYASADALTAWDAELTRLQSEMNPLSPLGTPAPAPIGVGMKVGALGWNPWTKYVYQLLRVSSVNSRGIGAGMAVGDTATNATNASDYRLDKVETWSVATTVYEPIAVGMAVGATRIASNGHLYRLESVVQTGQTEAHGPVVTNTMSALGAPVMPSGPGMINTPVPGSYNMVEQSTWSDLGAAGTGASFAATLSALSVTPVLSGWATSGSFEVITTISPSMQERATFTYVGAGTGLGDIDRENITVQPYIADAGWPTVYDGSFTLSSLSSDGETIEKTFWVGRGRPEDLSADVSVEQLARRYTARMDAVLTEAGIIPKSNASIGCGDGCWREIDGATQYWDTANYLPALTNEAYISSVRDGDCPVSTEEFGFAIMVDCEHALKVGDSITITISGSGSTSAYQEGDRFTIPVVAAAAAPLTGGEYGDAIHTWIVEGGEGGRYPDWLWQPSSPAAYAAGPLDATLAPGGIPFEPGDEIRIAIEGGAFRWRIDGGSWTTADLFATDHDIGNGLTLNAVQSSAPSFVSGDTWQFRAQATYGIDQLRAPREARAFGFDGATTQIDIDLGTQRPIDALMLALHSLPETASVAISAGASAIGEWSLDLPWRTGPMIALTGQSARYLRLTITGAGTGAEIGWLWAGTPWAPSNNVSSLSHVHQYGLTRGNGRNPGALYRGRGTGGKWGWSLDSGSLLLPADISALTEILDHIASNGLEWVCLVPDAARLETATLAQINTDEVTITEHLGFALDGDTAASAELPFRAVLR